MSTIGQGVIELSADSTKLTAGIENAKKSIKGLGKDIGDSVSAGSARASRSIDNYVKKLNTVAATNGMSARESELYTLSLRGASKAQLEAADSALRMNESYRDGIARSKEVAENHERLKTGFIALGAAAAAAAVATAAGTIALINQVDNYQDLAEKIGDTAVAVSSLKTASDVSGTSIDTIAAASIKLTAALSKTDDESKSAGAAIAALGLNFDEFKKQSPVEQLQSVSRAFDEFADGSEKTAVAVSLFGKSGAELLGFLKEYSDEGMNAAYVTEEQIKAADDFADSTAKLQSQFSQFLQVSAVNAVPILSEVVDLFTGVADAQDGTSTATEIVKSAIAGLVVVFQTIAVVGSDVVFTFKMVGQEIGAIAAQMAALARLDFAGFSAISDAVKDDAVRARAELDKFQARVMAVGRGTIGADKSGNFDDADARTPARPKRNVSGLNQDKTPKGKKDNSAAQEAKARLASDIDQIRKAQDALSNTIANSEKIMEAQRGAALISEAQYFTEKRRFLTENAAVQEAATQKEIARLQSEKVSGADKIENDRKIADAQSKLAKIRADSAANLEVLKIRETDSLTSISRAYADARQAAQSYLDVTNRARQAEVEGMGNGQEARDRAAAISQIEEKYEQQRQDLQRDNRNGKFAGRQEDYDRELALINEFQQKSIASYADYYAQIKAAQQDFTLGGSEALRNYYDESRNVFKQTQDAVTNAFQGMEDALVSFATTGKADFKSLANSIISDIARIAIKQSVTGPLASALSGLFTKNADGGVYNSPSLSAYSGQIVSKPTLFKFARGAGLMGEAGHEAILPLKRGTDGKLGVSAGAGQGGSGAPIFNIDARGADAGVEQRLRAAMPDIVRQTTAAVQNQANRGGSFAKSMGRR